eukprot:NODE_18532_length_888_cov_4.559790.p6 GENE.NODE_18532_length_888_cov_4.559790~~NODE_18532_length_888_cov_4.559790.p6  ORF type:complete len:50 (-),score=3.60 NODE_18532_length_888_cov_4.559790:498-647(-)
MSAPALDHHTLHVTRANVPTPSTSRHTPTQRSTPWPSTMRLAHVTNLRR